MARKPIPSQTTAPSKHDEFHIDLDLDHYDSEEYFDDGDYDLDNFSDSDDDFDSDVTLEDFAQSSLDLSKPNGQKAETLPAAKTKSSDAANGNALALVPTNGAANDPYDVDSDEEKSLLKGIKDEIRDMVREEMQSELAVYQSKVKAIEEGRLSSVHGKEEKEEDKYPDLANLEPQLRDAYIKMRKLDRILEKKVRKEKEVKRDRILLERRIRDEIGTMQNSGRVQRDIQTNTEKYLSLELPPSHNYDESDDLVEEEGVIIDDQPQSVTPVFQTQVEDQDVGERQQRKNSGKDSCASSRQGGRESSAASVGSHKSDSTLDGDRARKQARRKKKKDFIKRNKELAANANDMIAMTDDEKKRLQELLGDIDALPEISEEGSEVSASVEDNPYQVMIHPGEGFLPSDNELRSLTAIDERLQAIMPEDEFRSIASSVLSHTPQQRLFTRVGARAEVDFESYGEKALMETKEEREISTKLKDIEDRLTVYHNPDVSQSETPTLTGEQLENLLDDCVGSMSRVSLPSETPESVDSARTLESARAHLLVNPPHLSDEMLQKLLSEAHFPLSSHFLALQDDDSKTAHNEEEGMAIRAETWKAIAEEMLSDDEGDRESSTPVRMQEPQSQGANVKLPSSFLPRPSVSDTVVGPSQSQSRRQLFQRHSSQSEGRESQISLPEISSSPLINTQQGGFGAPNNDLGHYQAPGKGKVRTSASLDNMVRNDLSRELTGAGAGRKSSLHDRLSPSTPLTLEEIGDQVLPSPVPHPPPTQNKPSSGASRGGKTRADSKES